MTARMLAAAATVAALLVGPALARADAQPFGSLNCIPRDGVRFCQGQTSAGNDQRVKSFDGVPLDTDVALPASGDANLPLVVLLHGWGGSKVGFNQMKAWADRGYAVLSYTARGFNGSCGRPDNRLFDPSGCATGWLHLADVRWEVRDTQFLAGKLADQGLIDGQRIGVTGPSYGGGQAMDLAVLKDRYMDQDANLHPWVSDGGHPMRIAAAAPTIPWTDLAYSLEPNGRTLDYTIASPKDDVTPLGVDKQVVRERSVRARPGHRVLLAARCGPVRGPHHPVRAPQRGRADRSRGAGHRHGDHHLSLVVLPRPLGGARAAADRQRLHRRPVPGRRGAAVLQPVARAVPVRPDRADVLRLRPHAGHGQGGRHRAPAAAPVRLVRPLREGGRERPDADRRRDADPDVPEGRTVGRPVRCCELELAASRRGPVPVFGRATGALDRRGPGRQPRRGPDRRRRRRVRHDIVREPARDGHVPAAEGQGKGLPRCSARRR
jgi:hypothetical protein